MASFASSANTGGARKHTWTNLQFSCPVSDLMMKYFFCIQIHSAGQHNNICSNWYFKGFKFGLKITIIVWKNRWTDMRDHICWPDVRLVPKPFKYSYWDKVFLIII